MKTGSEEIYQIIAKCPECYEDWSWGYTKKELVNFAFYRRNENLICYGCKKVFNFTVLAKQLVV
jgi:hypothetical protein